MAVLLALVFAVIVALLAAEITGWIPRGSRALVGLAAKRFLAQHPEGDAAAEAITAEWKAEVLGDLGTLRDRPLSSVFFALRVLMGAPRSAKEYFVLDEPDLDPRPIRIFGRIAFRVLDAIVYVVAAVAMVPIVVVGVALSVILLPPYLVLIGIMMSTDGNESTAYRSAGVKAPPKFEAEDLISADTEIADLVPDGLSSESEATPRVAGDAIAVREP